MPSSSGPSAPGDVRVGRQQQRSQNKGDENMKTILVRLGFGIMLACIVGMVSGCAGRPMQAKSAPSYATFVITFQPDSPARPTGMEIQPDDGNVVLQVVKQPGPDDNKVVWQSNQRFSIKFGQLCDPSQPLPPGGELGDEGKDWNEAKEKARRLGVQVESQAGQWPHEGNRQRQVLRSSMSIPVSISIPSSSSAGEALIA